SIVKISQPPSPPIGISVRKRYASLPSAVAQIRATQQPVMHLRIEELGLIGLSTCDEFDASPTAFSDHSTLIVGSHELFSHRKWSRPLRKPLLQESSAPARVPTDTRQRLRLH